MKVIIVGGVAGGASCAARLRRPAWLSQLITRRVPPERIGDALARGPDDIKVVVEFGG